MDLYTKIVLTAIALLLAVIALRPVFNPTPARAQSDTPRLYIEPGVTSIRNSDGSSQGDGKLVIDLRTGDAWGFPNNFAGAPYPIDVVNNKPATSKPILLGRFDFSAMRR